ncbi:MAG TPA: hypothetical protein PLO23_04010 [Alphaproteobacteria bacterium]|nr:hypothetical protein [Alphaproteobacteria bacterium]
MSNIESFIRADNDNRPLPPGYSHEVALGTIIANALLEGRQARGIPNPARNIHAPATAEPESPGF